MGRLVLVLMAAAFIGACDDGEKIVDPPAGVDVSVRLAPGEVRAGAFESDAGMFGGVLAESRVGDLKIYNDRVQFVVQGIREASYYINSWGGVIDADIVRPEGQTGRDLIEKWGPMFGVGRLMQPTSIEVVNDGSNGEAAVIRAVGVEAPLALLEGAIETPGFVANLGLRITQEFTLEPDSYLLKVHTTAELDEGESDFAIADVLFGAPEVASRWTQGVGLSDSTPQSYDWTGYVDSHRRVAAAMFRADTNHYVPSNLNIIASITDLAVASGESQRVAKGSPIEFTRYYGVGPDLATLSNEALSRQGRAVDTISEVVSSPDGVVAGAGVVVSIDDVPYTVATTKDDGSFSVDVPAGSHATARAIGRGTGKFADLPPGAANWAAFATDGVNEASKVTYTADSAGPAFAEGRGIGPADGPLTLHVPATLHVTVADGAPFAVLVDFTAPDTAIPDGLAPGRPGGHAAAGWSRDGDIDLAVEPGTYSVTVHRGMRFSLHTETVTLTEGQTTDIATSLTEAYTHEGWILGDPHSHGAPSGDASINMEERVIVHAADGVQLHFGTDHDRVADYRPLVEALGLSPYLASIVSDEVSPPLRGHFNIYPVEPKKERANGGAYAWWNEVPPSTDAMVDFLREAHGPDFILQSNHPTSSGLASSAGWAPGQVQQANRWTDLIQAVEVLNSSHLDDYTEFWSDLLARGTVTTPVGVSDSHDHFNGHPGMSATFLHVGTAVPSEVTDAGLIAAMRARQTMPTRGVFLQTSVMPGATVGQDTEVDVTALSPDWIKVDRIKLMRDNNVEVERVDGSTAHFTLHAYQDAAFWVVAEGDTSMRPVEDSTPWAMTSPWLLDLDGAGWTPPLPPMDVKP